MKWQERRVGSRPRVKEGASRQRGLRQARHSLFSGKVMVPIHQKKGTRPPNLSIPLIHCQPERIPSFTSSCDYFSRQVVENIDYRILSQSPENLPAKPPHLLTALLPVYSLATSHTRLRRHDHGLHLEVALALIAASKTASHRLDV